MDVVELGGAPAWEIAGPAAAAPAGAAIIGYRDVGGTGLDLQVAGAAAVTLVIPFGDADPVVEDAFGRRRVGGFLAGLPLEAMRVRSERAECVEVRVSPIQAYSLWGGLVAELGCGAVDLEDLWGPRARRLRAQLAACRSWDERFAVTKAFLAQWDSSARTPDPEILAGWHRIIGSGGQVRVGELAASVGWSHKRFGARFESQIGLTPKRAAMLVRFRCAVDALLAGRPAAEVAAECGYVDQAHLCRDVSIFTDRTPGALTTHYLPPIARHRHRAWGEFFQYRPGRAGR